MMPRPRQTAQQMTAMRERILNASLELLRSGGPEAVSVRAIADRLGFSHMTLYTYFGSRDELMEALWERQRERMRERHEALLREAETGDVAATMRRSLAFYARAAQQFPHIYELIWVLPLPQTEELDKHRERLTSNLQYLARLVELGIARGVFAERDAMVAAATAMSIANGPLILYHSGRITDEGLRDRMVEEALDASMSYLCNETVSRRPKASSLCEDAAVEPISCDERS